MEIEKVISEVWPAGSGITAEHPETKQTQPNKNMAMQRDGATANEEVYFAESYCQAMPAMAPVQQGDAAHQELRLADLGQTCSYLGLLELCGALSF